MFAGGLGCGKPMTAHVAGQLAGACESPVNVVMRLVGSCVLWSRVFVSIGLGPIGYAVGIGPISLAVKRGGDGISRLH